MDMETEAHPWQVAKLGWKPKIWHQNWLPPCATKPLAELRSSPGPAKAFSDGQHRAWTWEMLKSIFSPGDSHCSFHKAFILGRMDSLSSSWRAKFFQARGNPASLNHVLTGSTGKAYHRFPETGCDQLVQSLNNSFLHLKMYDWSLESVLRGDSFNYLNFSLGLHNTVESGSTTDGKEQWRDSWTREVWTTTPGLKPQPPPPLPTSITIFMTWS